MRAVGAEETVPRAPLRMLQRQAAEQVGAAAEGLEVAEPAVAT